MSLENVVQVETLLILQENHDFDFLLELGGPVLRWMILSS